MTLSDTQRTPHGNRARLVKAGRGRQRANPGRPFVASVVVALVLNGALLTALSASVREWRVSTHPSRRVTWITAIAPAHASTPQDATTLRSAPIPPRVAEKAVTSTAEKPVPDSAPPAPTTESIAPAPESGNDVRFYDFREVDQPAEPDSDWNLDAALLDGAGVTLLVFEVFVDATGEVVACAILQPADLANDSRAMIEDRLRRTRLRPAIRAGEAVNSVRRIELSVQS